MKFKVKLRQVIHKEYEVEVDAKSAVEAMDLAMVDTTELTCETKQFAIAPVAVSEVKE